MKQKKSTDGTRPRPHNKTEGFSFQHITSRCFVNAPFERLESGLLQLFLDNRIQPEIGLEGDVLYSRSNKDFEAVSRLLKTAGLACTLHAPFFDLSPGALDHGILQATRKKLRKAFELIPVFEPASIVCHLNFEDNKHGYKEKEWSEKALGTWRELLAMAEAHRTPVMLENTYETTPKQHQRMLEALDSPYARFCLDVGHVMAFAKNTWQEWLPALEPWLGQLHLHDNQGDRDSHLAIGRGAFDFEGLFNYLGQKKLTPIITLEPHTEEDLEGSLEALDRLRLFDMLAAGQDRR